MMQLKQLKIGRWWLAVACLALAAPARADLIAFYPLDGNANDHSGNAHTGTIVGGVTFIDDGVDGLAGRFNGTDGHILTDVDINPGVVPQFTMGAWVRIPAGTPDGIRQIIAHDDGGWDRGIGTDTRNSGGFRYTGFNGSGPIDDTLPVAGTEDTWIFRAIVYDPDINESRIYADTEEVFSTATNANSVFMAGIGYNPGFGEYWLGDIDNVFMFNEALTTEQIEQIRDGGEAAIRDIGGIVFTPGDFNSDGSVDLDDYDILRNNMFEGSTFSQGDNNFSGRVDLTDFVEFKQIFSGGGGAPVPEPSAAVAMLIGLACLGLRARARIRR